MNTSRIKVEVNPTVFEFVKKALEENPKLGSKELQAQAALLDPEILLLTTQQFNARYALQVRNAKREHWPGARGSGSRTPRNGNGQKEVTAGYRIDSDIGFLHVERKGLMTTISCDLTLENEKIGSLIQDLTTAVQEYYGS